MAARPLNLDTPVCPSVLPLNPASLHEIDGVAMETPSLARPVPWLDIKPNGDGKPPAKSFATLARNLAIARFRCRSFGSVLVKDLARYMLTPIVAAGRIAPSPTSLNRDKK